MEVYSFLDKKKDEKKGTSARVKSGCGECLTGTKVGSEKRSRLFLFLLRTTVENKKQKDRLKKMRSAIGDVSAGRKSFLLKKVTLWSAL